MKVRFNWILKFPMAVALIAGLWCVVQIDDVTHVLLATQQKYVVFGTIIPWDQGFWVRKHSSFHPALQTRRLSVMLTLVNAFMHKYHSSNSRHVIYKRVYFTKSDFFPLKCLHHTHVCAAGLLIIHLCVQVAANTPSMYSQELFQLSQYLQVRHWHLLASQGDCQDPPPTGLVSVWQEALHREQMLEQKLATLQRLLANTQEASESSWQVGTTTTLLKVLKLRL